MRELDRDMGSKFASHGINTSLKQKENNHENVDKILTNLDSPYISHVRKSKTVLVSGFPVMDSGIQVLDSRFFVSGIPDSASKHFPDSGIPIPLH